jgi:hypothetical protein
MSNLRHGYTAGKRDKSNPRWRAHVVWLHMRQRCERPSEADAKNYRERGISYDPRWRSFEAFVEDMGVPPAGKTLERIDNDANYGPGNCKWASRREQSRNRRCNRWIEFNGQRKLIGDWAQELGVPVQRLKNRLHRGWPIARVLEPVNHNELRAARTS